MYRNVESLIEDCERVLDSGRSFRLSWVCGGCCNICLCNVPNAIYLRGLKHEECGYVTPVTCATIVIENRPVVIPKYEDIPEEIMRELFKDAN